MKKAMIGVLIAGVLFIALGVVGSLAAENVFNSKVINDEDSFYFGRGMMYDDDEGRYFGGPGMMFDFDDESESDTSEKMDMDELTEIVEEYISEYDEELVISDIFVFEDSDYYFSIAEADTAMGAMELLVDPETGMVYPEFGPNMMWNLKYGMHGGSSFGMMGGRRSMGGRYRWDYDYSDFEGNTVSKEEAVKLAAEYAKENIDGNPDVSGEGHEFYGYYTFHLEKDGQTTGMLSVNGLTGEVWYHTWHGTLTEIISGHSVH